MEEKIEFISNDTVRAIDRLIQDTHTWQSKSPRAKGRETDLVITKLKEARFWALVMVDRDN